MSRDIFALTPPVGSPSSWTTFGFAGGPRSEPENGVTYDQLSPAIQRIIDEENAEIEIERARKEVEMNTPENRRKAAEEEMAERERKRVNFDYCRAMVDDLNEGWKQLRDESTEKEIRVYTTDYFQRRFWGIKPAGIEMDDFWEQVDPEVSRYDDNIAITWSDPLIRPPVTAHDELVPEIWAGRGVNPDSIPAEPPTAKDPPPIKVGRSRGRPKKSDVNPNHRFQKSTTASSNINTNNPQKSLANKIDAGHSSVEQQILEEAGLTSATGRPSLNKTIVTPLDAQHEPTTKDKGSTPSKRPRGRPASTANPASKSDASWLPKRPRGRPAKQKPAVKSGDDQLLKRPRGRPPSKGKPAFQGNARITKSSQTIWRPSAPKIRTIDRSTASSENSQDHPASTVDPASKSDASSLPKRTRGRPTKPKPAVYSEDTQPSKRPRGRPPGKGKSAVQGNTRITKSSQTSRRPSAPSIDKIHSIGKSTAPSERPQDYPASTANPASKSDALSLPKRPRGRPAKPKPAAENRDAQQPKRSRGRPPGKGKPAAQGNARVTKPSQPQRRLSALSNHKMSTRGSALLLQLL